MLSKICMCRIKHSINIYRSSTSHSFRHLWWHQGSWNITPKDKGGILYTMGPLERPKRETTPLHSEVENQNKPFSFNFGGGNFHSQILGFPMLPQSTPKPDGRKKVEMREKLNVTSLCLHNKRVGTNAMDLINGSNKIIWDFMAYWSTNYAWEVPIHHLWGQRTPRENAASAAHHSHPSVIRNSVALSSRKTSAKLNKAVFFLQGKRRGWTVSRQDEPETENIVIATLTMTCQVDEGILDPQSRKVRLTAIKWLLT